MEKVDLVVIAKAVITMNKTGDVFEPGYLAVNNGNIISCGNASKEIPYKGKEVLHLPGHVVMPGLINTHTHAPMVLFRGLADDLPLKEWLENHIWPMEKKHVSQEFVYDGSLIACAEMALNGVTTFVDMYFSEDKVAEAAKRIGIRACVGEGILDFPTPISPTLEDSFKRAEETVKSFLDEDLIRPMVTPHAPYTCSKDTLKRAQSLAEKYGVPLHIHVAEEEWEVESFKKDHGMSPVKYLDSIGFFDTSPVILAHVNWVDDEDIDILKSKNVGVAHNPQSNMKLSTGICPVPKMLKKGINVGLGTDGASSNNDLSLLDEAQEAARLHKISTKDPTSVSAFEALKMSTIMGAKVINEENNLGSLEVGKKADFIAINFEKIHLKPVYDYYSHLIYAARASDIEFVYVSGKPVVFESRLKNIKEDEIFEIAEKWRQRIKKD